MTDAVVEKVDTRQGEMGGYVSPFSRDAASDNHHCKVQILARIILFYSALKASVSGNAETILKGA